jgi:hypothetical protein
VREARNEPAGLGDAVAAWAVVAVVAPAVFTTYWRLPAESLYHTSVEGLAGGAGRTLVVLNFPAAVVAIAIVPLAVDRLLPRRPRAASVVGIAAVALCAVALVPGVIDIDDLDARPINAVPAAGVALVLALTAAAARSRGLAWRPRALGDGLRVAIAVALAVLGIPWFFAEWGFYAPDPILADEVPPGETAAAVHLGHHHGTDGIVLALAALVLSRVLGTYGSRRLEAVASGYLALMLAYGLTNVVEDFWLEQVVKRGWTDHAIPNVIRPVLEPTWAAVLLGALAIEVLWFRRARAGRRYYARTSSSHSDIGT